MSGDNKTNEYPTISDLFNLLNRWRHLPNYQLECRADVFFALFLPEVLEKECDIKIKQPLIPEFPVDKNKGDRGHKQQEEMLRRVACKKSLKCLLEDVKEIAQYKNGDSKQKTQKYVHLLSHLCGLKLVKFSPELYGLALAKNSKGIATMLSAIELTVSNGVPLKVIYVQPEREQPDKNDHTVIDFDTFSDVIMKSYRGSDDVRILFACHLRKWASEKQAPGLVDPRAWRK